jgi:hypothetical protein
MRSCAWRSFSVSARAPGEPPLEAAPARLVRLDGVEDDGTAGGAVPGREAAPIGGAAGLRACVPAGLSEGVAAGLPDCDPAGLADGTAAGLPDCAPAGADKPPVDEPPAPPAEEAPPEEPPPDEPPPEDCA